MRNNNILIGDEKSFDKCIYLLDKDISKTIEYIKFTSGTIIELDYLSGKIVEFIYECRKKGIECYVGGGEMEIVINQNGLEAYIKYLKSLGIEVVEFSDNNSCIQDGKKFNEIVSILSNEFNKVLIEIGTKSESDFSIDYKHREESINIVFQYGIDGIIIEGGLGDVGIYDKNGKVKTLLLVYILKKISELGFEKDIILETYTKKLQESIISLIGSDVKLGNIYLPNTGIEEVNNIREFKGVNNTYLNNYYKLIDKIFNFCKEYNINPNYFFFNSFHFSIENDFNSFNEKLEKEMDSISGKDTSSIIYPSNPELFFIIHGFTYQEFIRKNEKNL